MDDGPVTAVPLERLSDDPERFSFSWPGAADRERLEQSLRHHGVLRPLIVAQQGGRTVVVSGSRRLRVLRRIGARRAPVRVAALDGTALWDHLLADHLDHRALNPVEVGLYLRRRTRDTGERLEDLAPRVFPLMGLAPRVSAARDPLWLAGLPPDLRDAVAEGRMPPAAARVLASAPRDDALAVLRWLGRWRLGVNRFAEAARWALECAWAQGKPVCRWLAEQGLDRWEGPPQDLLRRVRRARYPTLSALERDFAGCVRALGLPEGVRIEAPPGFEGGFLVCSVRFRDLEELAARLRELAGRVEAGRWNRLKEFLG